jgi:hypothetical protein
MTALEQPAGVDRPADHGRVADAAHGHKVQRVGPGGDGLVELPVAGLAAAPRPDHLTRTLRMVAAGEGR